MNFLESNKRIFWILFTIYFTANITLLINYNGIYWDDWVLYNNSFETINNMFLQAAGNAAYPTSALHYFLINYFGVFSYRLLTFVLLFLNGWFVFKILSTLSIFSNKDKFFITLFFLIAPLYSAKIAIINFPYTFYSTFFFFGFYLLSIHLNKLRIFKRIFILSLFFISFLINSIIVFYAIVLIYIFYKSYNIEVTFFKNIISFIYKKLDFIILPIIFFIIKSIYFVPTGLYAGYNGISLSNIINPTLYYLTFMDSFIEPIKLSFYYLTFMDSFIEPIKLSLENISSLFILGLIITILLYTLFSKRSKKDVYLLILGIIIFLLGAISYIVVNKLPANYNWSSRFQLLLPLGFSFILYYGTQVLSNLLNFNVIVKYLIFLIFLFSFMFYNLKEQYKHNIDWMYQQSIIENFRNTSFVQNNNTFEVVINLNGKLAQKRTINFYELNGHSKIAFGKDDKLFFVNSDNKTNPETFDNIKKFPQYNFSSWEKSDTTNIEINDNMDNQFNKGRRNSLIYFFRLKYLELTNIEKFRKEIKNLINLEFK